MDIPLYLHLALHFFIALLSGILAGNYFNNKFLGITAGLAGGFLIDLDHVLEYFLVFGWQFNLQNFFKGYQFLVSEKLHLLFHSWELIPLLLLLAYFFRRQKFLKIVILTVVFSGTIHLISDVIINQVKPQFYSFAYRASGGFAMKNLMSPETYQLNQKLKKELGI